MYDIYDEEMYDLGYDDYVDGYRPMCRNNKFYMNGYFDAMEDYYLLYEDDDYYDI